MKVAYDLAPVITAYLCCMDDCFSAQVDCVLLTAAPRNYTTAYAIGENRDTVNYCDSQTKGDCDNIANVLSCNDGVATVEMHGRFAVGDRLEGLSPSENFGKCLTVAYAYASTSEQVNDCKLVQEKYKINCPYALCAGDILRRRK